MGSLLKQSQGSQWGSKGFLPYTRPCKLSRNFHDMFWKHKELWKLRIVFQFSLRNACKLFTRLQSLDHTSDRHVASNGHSSWRCFPEEGSRNYDGIPQFQLGDVRGLSEPWEEWVWETQIHLQICIVPFRCCCSSILILLLLNRQNKRSWINGFQRVRQQDHLH